MDLPRKNWHTMRLLPSTDNVCLKPQLAPLPLHPLLAQDQWYQEKDLPSHRADIPIWGESPGLWSVGVSPQRYHSNYELITMQGT